MEEKDSIKPEAVETKVSAKGPVEEEPVVFRDKPKKKANVLTIILGILALVFAGAAIFFGLDYFGIIGKERIREVVTVETVPEEVVVEIMTSTMAEEYKDVVEMMGVLTEGIKNDWDYIENSSGLMYKPERLNSYVPMKFSLSKRIHNSSSNDVNMSAVKNQLSSSGFVSIGILPHGGSAGPEISGYYNSEKDIVCGVYQDVDWRLDNAEYVGLTCAKTSWVWLTREDEVLINGLAEAAKVATGEYPKVLQTGNKIENSQYEPYQTLIVGVGGAAGLFYRTSPEAEWRFFTATQAALACDEYDTDDLKRAYLGTYCWDTNNGVDSEVKL